MGIPVDFKGSTHNFGPPVGREESVGRLPCFLNGVNVVCAWELSDEEIEDIVKTRQVWVSMMTGMQVFPVYAGSEKTTAAVVIDTGKIWR